eukprot:TRINITY_DN9096_c0_g2_i1.p3 TRINITY_DN9096_c0_g2~~TRINITY_DN9096_c0_g2_i1.p3  ORF type:complete len:115 (+),score=15.18 TRINITY_DN9096_c0_g2_i1:69-413(+)
MMPTSQGLVSNAIGSMGSAFGAHTLQQRAIAGYLLTTSALSLSEDQFARPPTCARLPGAHGQETPGFARVMPVSSEEASATSHQSPMAPPVGMRQACETAHASKAFATVMEDVT